MSLEVRELTPPGSGAVSVLRLSGAGALAALRALSGGADLAPGAPRLVRLRLDGEDLDEAVACGLSADEVELQVHGSPPLVRRLIDHLGRGAAIQRGPRSLEERAALLLAHAPCEVAARILLDQAEGALSNELRALAGMGEAQSGRTIDALLERWRIARRALEPAEVVIAGPVNAGKSTLFNALLGEDRAIVSPEPGTTRDLLRELALLGAWPAWLVDTAGERDSSAAGAAASVEEQGRQRGRRARGTADLVLWLEPLDPSCAPVSRPPTDSGGRVALVHTFADLAEDAGRVRGAISALRDASGARACVAEVFRAALALPVDPWTPGTAVPITADMASAIGTLRGRSGADLAREIEAVIGGATALA